MKPDAYSPNAVVDRAELIERMMGSVQMADRMLQRFLDGCESETDLLESAVRMGNPSEIASLAHRHMGTAKTLSATRVAQRAAELEQRAPTDSTSQLLQLVDQIRDCHRELRFVVERGFEATAEEDAGVSLPGQAEPVRSESNFSRENIAGGSV